MSRPEGPMQRRIREMTERALEQAGYTRYDDGTLRKPPETCTEAGELALAEEAERLLTQRTSEELQEEKKRLERLIAMHKAGMVSTKAVMEEAGLDASAEAKK